MILLEKENKLLTSILDMSLSELKELRGHIDHLIRTNQPILRVGQKCEVDSPKVFGMLGEIVKVNRTRCKVKFEGDYNTWNVPKSMIILK